MIKFPVLLFMLAVAGSACAAWGFSSDGEKSEPPRISVLMRQATKLIEEASDLAEEGKIDASVEKYRAALAELDRVERENPDRAESAEFATLRNKRAYVNAAIDSMLLRQVRTNARAVAVSDTTELEKRLAAERKGKGGAPSVPQRKPVAVESARDRALRAISKGEFATAASLVEEMLGKDPKGDMALNLKALLEMRQGKTEDAVRTLELAMEANPKSYFAYYNMARLRLEANPADKETARRYYETGAALGGPADKALEAKLK